MSDMNGPSPPHSSDPSIQPVMMTPPENQDTPSMGDPSQQQIDPNIVQPMPQDQNPGQQSPPPQVDPGTPTSDPAAVPIVAPAPVAVAAPSPSPSPTPVHKASSGPMPLVSVATSAKQVIVFRAHKQGGSVKNWKLRYFHYYPNSHEMTYFSDPTCNYKEGHVDLENVLEMGTLTHSKFSHILGLRTKDRMWVIAFDSASDMAQIQNLLAQRISGTFATKAVPSSFWGNIFS